MGQPGPVGVVGRPEVADPAGHSFGIAIDAHGKRVADWNVDGALYENSLAGKARRALEAEVRRWTGRRTAGTVVEEIQPVTQPVTQP